MTLACRAAAWISLDDTSKTLPPNEVDVICFERYSSRLNTNPSSINTNTLVDDFRQINRDLVLVGCHAIGVFFRATFRKLAVKIGRVFPSKCDCTIGIHVRILLGALRVRFGPVRRKSHPTHSWLQIEFLTGVGCIFVSMRTSIDGSISGFADAWQISAESYYELDANSVE